MSLAQIEQSIDVLPYEELMHLLENLVQSLKKKSSSRVLSSQQAFEQQIALMANDPDIQSELAEINRDFSVTELDGLEK